MNRIVLLILKITAILSLLFAGIGFFIGAKILNSGASIFKSSGLSATSLNIISELKNTDWEEKKELIAKQNDGRTNILFLGKGGKGHPGGELTDAIMMLSIKYNAQNAPEAALISIPRDFYVPIPKTPYYTRINAVKSYGSDYLVPKKITINSSPEELLEYENLKEKTGVDLLKKVFENTLGAPIHYYIELDFDGFTGIIDELGGIDFTLGEDINDPLYPGPNYSFDPFYIKKGTHHLDGKTVLKLMRTRHSPQGDFNRIARQQKLLSLIKNKAITGNPLRDLFLFGKISESLSRHMFTDMEISDFKILWEMGKNINPEKVIYKVIDKENGFLKGEIINGAMMLVPKSGDYENIKNAISFAFDSEKQKTLSEKTKENESLAAEKNELENIAAEKPAVSLIIKSRSNISYEKILLSLKEKGFEVVKINHSEINLQLERNIVYNNSAGKKSASLKYLEKSFNAKIIESANETSTDSDFTIIINN